MNSLRIILEKIEKNLLSFLPEIFKDSKYFFYKILHTYETFKFFLFLSKILSRFISLTFNFSSYTISRPLIKVFFSPSFSVDYKSYEITDTNLTKKEIIYFFPYLWGPLNPFSLAIAVYSFPFCYASVLIIFRPLLLRLSAILCVPKSSFPIPIRSNRLEYPTTGINRDKVLGCSSDILNYISMPKKKTTRKNARKRTIRKNLLRNRGKTR